MLSSSSKQKTNYALAISHIVKELITSYESGATLNLTKLKGDAAKKFSLQGYVIRKECVGRSIVVSRTVLVKVLTLLYPTNFLLPTESPKWPTFSKAFPLRIAPNCGPF